MLHFDWCVNPSKKWGFLFDKMFRLFGTTNQKGRIFLKKWKSPFWGEPMKTRKRKLTEEEPHPELLDAVRGLRNLRVMVREMKKEWKEDMEEMAKLKARVEELERLNQKVYGTKKSEVVDTLGDYLDSWSQKKFDLEAMLINK
jgi:hypothetical protein